MRPFTLILFIVMMTSNETIAISDNWHASGMRWGWLVEGLSAGTKTRVFGGNDIEDWYLQPEFANAPIPGEPDPDLRWTACGAGSEDWINGYNLMTSRKMVNGGSYPQNTAAPAYPNQWSDANRYYVSWGHPSVLMAPQVYSPNHATDWAYFANNHTIYFQGLTSTNGSAYGNTTGLTAHQAWNAFYTALEQQRMQHRLAPAITTYHFDTN